ncbi:hypothetical protein [Micromonospora sp. NPDC005197]|uniref:hypothetical protein n=1 Tax=Micromonospora sp. NPDC005197 TaxID=3157020 RepID=UPI0033B5D494
MSASATAWASAQRPGDPLAKLVLITLANGASGDDGRPAWLGSVTDLAARCDADDLAVVAALATLTAAGYVCPVPAGWLVLSPGGAA